MMKMTLHITVLIVLCFCQGCATNFYLQKEAGPIPVPQSRGTVFVTNPNLRKEYRIVEGSGIVHLTDNSDCPNKITLDGYKPLTMCGMPFLVSLFTLGLVPVSVPQYQDFTYTLVTPDGRQNVRFHLPVYFRYSVWEGPIGLFHSNEKTLAKALAIAAQKTDNEKSQQGGGRIR
jgi:hypothetical protein